MKKLFLTLSVVIATLLGLSSCLTDGSDPSPPVVENGFLMLIDIPGSSSGEKHAAGTRSATVPAEPGESDVHTLHLLFFEASENRRFVDVIDASPEEGEVLAMTTPVMVDFANTNLNAEDAYQVLVVANIGDFLPRRVVNGEETLEPELEEWLDSFENLTFSEAEATLLSTFIIDGISGERLLMSSVIERRANQSMVHASLIRAVVRFDVEMDIPTTHTLRTVSVWNVPAAPAIWNSNYNIFTAHTEFFYRVDVQDGRVEGLIYAFENSVTGSFQGDNFTTCLILGIADETGRITYYRVNVATTGEEGTGQQVLRRNFVYRVTVTGVRGPGENTEQDAYRGTQTMLDVSITDWRIDDQSMIMFDGEDILALPTSRINLPLNGTRDEHTMDHPTHGLINTYEIFAHSPTPGQHLAFGTRTLPDGITVGWLNDNPATRTMWVRATPTVAHQPRNGSVEIVFGSMRGIIQIYQTDTEDKFLNLSIGTHDIPEFDVDGPYAWAGNVTVETNQQSDTYRYWTATIHNPGFNFVETGGITTTGENGGSFRITTIGDNAANPDPRYAFVIAALTNDPEINRVLVLRQSGSSMLTLQNLEDANIAFDAEGRPINPATLGSDYHLVRIFPSPADWQLIGSGLHLSHFDLTPVTEGNNHFVRIRSTGRNVMPHELTATATPFLVANASIRQDIRIRQEAHSITLTPNFVSSVPAATGGSSAPMLITSTLPISELNVEITVEGAPAGHDITLNQAALSNGFIVVDFPVLAVTDFAPIATVTVSIAGAPTGSLTQTVQVRQGQMILRDLYIRTARTAYWGTWHPSGGSAANRATLGRLREEIASRTNFGGPTAVVRSGAHIFSSVTGGSVMPTNNTDIFLANNTTFSATDGASIRSWVAGDTRRVLIVTHETVNTGASNILADFGFSGFSIGGNDVIHTVVSGTTALHTYMFKDGPFANGTDISSSIVMRPADGTGGSVPASGLGRGFIPLMARSGGSRVTVAINPELRIVYIGEPELFGLRSGATNWGNAANVTFVRNLAAWIVNVAQHGEDFLKNEGMID